MEQGWISIHRKLREHWLWQETPFDKRSAWIDILMSANHCDNKVLLGKTLIDVSRGQFITSEVKLMKKWGWSKTKVRSFLDMLEKENMIIKTTDTKKTTLTVVNYSDYQDSETAKELQKNRTETAKEPPEDRKRTAKKPQKDTNNNSYNSNTDDNEDNSDNVLEDIYSPEKEIFDFWNSKDGVIKSHEKSFDKGKISTAIKNYGYQEIITAIKRLSDAVTDNGYYYNFNWNIYKFLKQSNGISNWLDDGQLWNDYESCLSGTKKIASNSFSQNQKASFMDIDF